MNVVCPACNKESVFSPCAYRCECGSAWLPQLKDDFDIRQINPDEYCIARYACILGENQFDWSVSLGGGWSPLVKDALEHGKVIYKLEYVSPTGSFKDRGTELEMAFLKAAGVRQVVEDSSGNAGASMAAYAAKSDIRADIYVPDSAPRAKLDQIAVFGACLHRIPGPRFEATKAVLEAVSVGAVYASHAYNPVYLLGQQTFAWEIWEQMAENIPDAVVMPVGQGGLFLGAYLGFDFLHKSGVIDRFPKLFAVQPERLAPVCHAFTQGLDDIPRVKSSGKSIADGVAIPEPVRGSLIIEALRESDGAAIRVSEHAIKSAYFALAEKGLFVEPTAAAAEAALPVVKEMLGENSTILVALTGSGIKTPLLVK